MAIYLTDNFHLNSNLPFDVRAVVGSQSYYLTKDDILYKYPGLRIWDFNTGSVGTPFVWNGDSWISENTTGAIIPTPISGNANYITKFIGNTSLAISRIYDNGLNIGIGLTANSIVGPTNSLHVAGEIRTNVKFVGNGSGITTINASNISSGSLALDRISKYLSPIPSTSYILTQTNTTIQWSEFNSNPSVELDDLSLSTQYLSFVDSIGTNKQLKVKSTLNYIPGRDQLINGIGNSVFPAYSFTGNTEKGIYLDNGSLTFTIGSIGKVNIVPYGINIYQSDYPQISFQNNNKSRVLLVNNNDKLLFRENSFIDTADRSVWHDSNLYHLRQISSLTSLETGRTVNSITTNGQGSPIGGIYSYTLNNDNVMNSSISPFIYTSLQDSKKYWSSIVIGNGANGGNFQIVGNFKGVSASNREMLVRGLDSDNSVPNWSEWSRVCLNEVQGFKWSIGKTHSTRDMMKIWLSNNLPKTIKTGLFDPGGTTYGDTLIPYNPTPLPLGSTGNYDRFGAKDVMGQAWHNIPGYEIRYYHYGQNGGESSIFLVMFKVTSGPNTFINGIMSEWSLYSNSISASYIWTPQSLSSGGGGTFNGAIVAPTVINISGAAVDSFITTYSTRPGFSTVRMYVKEGEGVIQAISMALELQQRTVSDLPI